MGRVWEKKRWARDKEQAPEPKRVRCLAESLTPRSVHRVRSPRVERRGSVALLRWRCTEKFPTHGRFGSHNKEQERCPHFSGFATFIVHTRRDIAHDSPPMSVGGKTGWDETYDGERIAEHNVSRQHWAQKTANISIRCGRHQLRRNMIMEHRSEPG
jgi:hypothetical protein